MDNAGVASLLLDIARLLELEGEETFKIRAYRKAAQSVSSLEGDIGEYYRQGRLRTIPGIGPGMESIIVELFKTGRSEFYESLKKEIPPALYDVLAVPGIGRKTALKVHKALGIATVGEFRDAARMHRIRNVKGMGEKAEKKILASIDEYRRMEAATGVPIVRAVAITQDILSYFKDDERFISLMAAGDVRRKAPMSEDFAFVASAIDVEAAVKSFCSAPFVSSIKNKEPGHAVVGTRYRVDVSFNASEPEYAGLNSVLATGSNAHLEALQALSPRICLDRTGFADEAALYASLGMQYVPPELREGRGEVEAALEGRLPRLIEKADIRGDFHVHSDWSDGAGTIAEVAMAARAKGYEYVAICDHSQSLTIAGGLTPDRLMRQIEEIDRINDTLEGFTILKGCEVDIRADGTLDMPDTLLDELDIVVGSVHTSLRQDPEVITRRVLDAFDTGYVTILAHPTSRILGRRSPTMIDIDRVIESAADHGVVLEINSFPDRLDLSDENVRKAVDAGAMLAIDTDAHALSEMGFMDFGVWNARRGWATADNVLNSMTFSRLLGYLDVSL